MAKKKQQKTDTIIIQVGTITTNRKSYTLKCMIIADGKEGHPKADCPIELYADNKKKGEKNTDSEGHADFKINIPYEPYKKSVALMAKVSGSTARELKSVPLPAPFRLNIKVGKIKNEQGAFSIPVEVVAFDTADRPRPNTEIILSFKEEEKTVVSDQNGRAEHIFSASLQESGEERKVVAKVGSVMAEDSFSLPRKPGKKKLSTKIREWAFKD